MGILEWATSPLGHSVPIHIAWFLIWVALIAGLVFLIVHAIYVRYFTKNAESAPAPPAEALNLPARIPRHGLAARLFHWIMAAAMFVLLFTAFLPIAGVKFPWVQWHWIAGLVLTASILFHIIHATFFLDFWSIWVGPRDIPELKNELLREFGRDIPGPKDGKYPLGIRLYHTAIVVSGLTVVGTGLFLLKRVRTPFFV